MRLILCIIVLLYAPFSAAGPGTAEINATFISGLRAYDSEQYERAAALFEMALQAQPDCARCAHLLGKSYGNLAERAAWTRAIGLAKKTRVALEQAVELAPHDREAVRDLIRYYRAAPGFLGGSSEKAEALEQRLRRAETGHTG